MTFSNWCQEQYVRRVYGLVTKLGTTNLQTLNSKTVEFGVVTSSRSKVRWGLGGLVLRPMLCVVYCVVFMEVSVTTPRLTFEWLVIITLNFTVFEYNVHRLSVPIFIIRYIIHCAYTHCSSHYCAFFQNFSRFINMVDSEGLLQNWTFALMSWAATSEFIYANLAC